MKNNISASTNSQGPVESKVVAKLYFSYLKERKKEGGKKRERWGRGWEERKREGEAEIE